MICHVCLTVYAYDMKSPEISQYASLEEMSPILQHDVIRLITLGKLSTEDITQYEGWLLARTDNDELVGCVGVELRSPHAYMESLVVHPDMRRHGLGRKLTDRLFELCVVENAGMQDLTAMTLFWNNRFYESLNFERVNPRTAKVADDVAGKEKHRYCTVWRKSISHSQF